MNKYFTKRLNLTMRPILSCLFLACSLTMISCNGATLVTRPTVSKYAPKGYNPTGLVKYLNNGADSIIEQRRNDAFKKMHDACHGSYKILSEGRQKEGEAIYHNKTYDTYETTSYDYWYISFKCGK